MLKHSLQSLKLHNPMVMNSSPNYQSTWRKFELYHPMVMQGSQAFVFGSLSTQP
jgi:hypothetical protein